MIDTRFSRRRTTHGIVAAAIASLMFAGWSSAFAQETDAVDAARKLLANGQRKEAWRRLDVAIARLSRIAEERPEDPRALYELARVRYERRPDEASIALVDRALALAPEDADILIFRGWVFFQSNHTADAERCFDTAVERSANAPLRTRSRNRFERARFLIAAEREDEADTALQAILADDAEFSEARVELAAKWFESDRREDALTLLADGVERDPKNIELRDNYGQLLQIAGREADAYEQYSRLAETKPDHFRAACKLVQLATALKRDSDAAKHAERVRRLHAEGKSDTAWFCREVFTHAGKRIFAQEYFDPRGARRIYFRFDVIDEAAGGKSLYRIALASYDKTTEAAVAAGAIAPDERVFHVDKHEEKKVETYERRLRVPPTYSELKKIVEEIVAGERQPLADDAVAP